MTVQGSIFNIMRYSTKDGPGLRTTVFLKGCPLSCLWCHNPESQLLEAEFIFHKNFCINCGTCAEYCPQHAISMNDIGPEFPDSRCDRCQGCVKQCPSDAREFLGSEKTVAEIINLVLRDRIFFDESGGGVTFSGGEPLSQPDFLLQLCKSAKNEEIHVAIDTTLHAPWPVIQDLIPYVDLFMVDLKVFDEKEHEKLTGVSNSRIIENLKRLDAMNIQCTIRMPIIPGFTDKDEDLNQRIAFLSTLGNVVSVELLPYHSMADGKLQSMNKQKSEQEFDKPENSRMIEVRNMLLENEIPVAEFQE